MAKAGRRTSSKTKKAGIKSPKKSTKKSLTPLPKLIKLVQAKANLYARLRDCRGTGGASCISCGKWFPFAELDGGHYIPTTVSSTRFDPDNIHAQCHRCNRFLHANLRGYFRGLEAKLGRSRLDAMEASAGPKKWTRPELLEIKASYTEKIKKLQSDVFEPEGEQTVLDIFAGG